MNDLEKGGRIQTYTIEQLRRNNFGIVSIASLIIILVFCFFTFLRELIISLKDYAIFKGILSSPWIGLKNYQDLITSVYFPRIILNTFVFNLLFACISFGIALVIGYVITAFQRRSLIKDVLVMLFAIPIFIPANVYGSWLINLLDSSLFVNSNIMRFLHPLFCSIKYVGIPVIVTYVLDETYENKDKLLPLKAVGLFSLISLAFITNTCFSMTSSLYNPTTYETMDMADTYIFRKGLAEMQVGLNSAMGVIRTLISIFSAAVLFIPIKYLFSATFKGGIKRLEKEKITNKVLSSVIALAVFTIIYFLPYMLRKQSFDTSNLNVSLSSSIIMSPIIIYMMLSIVSALIATAIAAVASRAFIATSKVIRWFAVVLLLLITIFTIRPVSISSYLLIRQMGFVNTVFAIILSTCFSAAAVWAMACILHNESSIPNVDSTESYKSLSLALIGIFLMQTAIVYINPIPALLYLHNTRLSPFLTFRQITLSIQSITSVEERASVYGVVGLYGFIISLPSIIIFLFSRIILRKEHLLAIISGGLKD